MREVQNVDVNENTVKIPLRARIKQRGHKFFHGTRVGRFTFKNRFYLLAAFIPLLILTIAYIALGIWPFGERQVQIIDSYHQYVPFFSEFVRKIRSGESLFYSWNGGLGMNFWAVFAYYLASPLNFLLLLFPDKFLLEGFTFILMIKVALSGFTFSYYISKRFKRYDITIVYFAMFYALCGWVLGYNWNIMWLDCLVLLPLIILGLERLVKEGKGLLYGITLGICIITNYYIAIMICMFLVLYFFVLFFENKKKNVRLFFRRGFLFAGYSLLAGALSACLLLPTLAGLAVSNSAESKFPTNIKFYHSIGELFSRQFAIVEPTDLSGDPNLYFGVFTLLLVILYIFRKGIPLGNKILKLLLLGFLLFSTNFRILDYIWHGFHFPNSLPARFTFIYAFLALTMAYEVFLALRKYEYWQLAVPFVLMEALLAWCYFGKAADQEIYTYIVTEILVIVYFILICIYKKKFKRQRFIQGLLMVFLFAEVTGNSVYGLCRNGSISRTSYIRHVDAAKELKKTTDALENNGFYRMELDSFAGRNNNMWLDFPGISLFASTMGADINDLMGEVGYFSATNKYSYVGGTPLTDSIFGLKYLVSQERYESLRTFHNIDEAGETNTLYLNANPYALSLGFMVDNAYADWNHKVKRPEYVLNDFVQKTTGTTDFLFNDEPLPELLSENCTLESTGDGQYSYKKAAAKDEASVKFSLDITDGQTRYIYYQAANCSKLKVSRNDSVKTYTDTRGHLVELGNDGHIDVELVTDDEHTSGNIKIYLFSYDASVFEQFHSTVSQHQWELTEYTDTYLTGTIQAEKDGIMYTSIPYDKGWKVTVDGKPVETESIDGTLLYIHLPAGQHTITMHYTPTGFIPGFIISMASCLIFVVIYSRKLRKKNHNL